MAPPLYTEDTMLVKAKKMGYYGHARRREGAEFELDEKLLEKEDGKYVLPKWVEPVETSKPSKKNEVKKAVIDQDIEVI